MPKKKKLYIDYPEFLLYEVLDHCMFCYILGIQDAMPSTRLNEAMEMFMDKFNLNEDIYPLDQGLRIWYRMHSSYVKMRKELDR